MKNSNKLLSKTLAYACLVMLVLISSRGFSQTQTLVSHNFSSICSLPSGWQIQNVDGGCTWRCDAGGFTQNNHSSQGCSGAANDWLILPFVNFVAYQNENMNVSVGNQYSGGSFTLYYSTNYSGTGSPASATWSPVYGFGGASTVNINLNALAQSGYLAFVYTSSGNGTGQAARWTITNVTVTGEPALVVDSLKITSIATTQVGLEATVLNTGGQTVTDRGFLWSTTPNPLLNGTGVTQISVTGGLGQFSASAAGLPAGTRIYVKGFASTASFSRYTPEKSFYTLSTEPSAYPSTFTATALSKNSIQLDWSEVSSATGYLIILRKDVQPTGIPTDATSYNALNQIGNGEVAAVITSGSTTTATIQNLIQGSRYHFTLFPYAHDGTNTQTLNYKTNPVIPSATDSTFGLPPSYRSILVGIAGTEAIEISSLKNEAIADSSQGIQVWNLQLRDGGISMNDADDLPTILSGIVLSKGAYNTVANWQQSIKSAVLVDDSTGMILATGTVGLSSITFSGLSLVAADDNYRPLRLKLSLKETAHTDHSVFQFSVNTASVQLVGPLYSSQADNFASVSDSSKNEIEVVASKLSFVNHPSLKVEAGTYLSFPIQVAARDTFNGLDKDFTDTVTLNASAGNLIPSPRTSVGIEGIASFDTLRFFKAALYDTLLASSDLLNEARGNRFEVEVSKNSDIVTNTSFTYPQNFRHLDYLAAGPITQTNSLEVFNLWLRDGGANGDNDYDPTSLTRLDISVTNASLVRGAALFAGSKKLAETNTILVSGSTNYLSFTSIDTLANDDDSINLSLRLTFIEQANDGDRLSFTIKEAFSIDTLSKFATSNAGGAMSSTLGNNNKINIEASRLMFVKQPMDTYRGGVMKPEVSVVALDSVGNKDFTGRSVTLSTAGSVFASGTINTRAITSIKQGAEFDQLIFAVAASEVYLVAHATNLDSALSDTFSVIVPVWYRSIKSGNWSDVSVWESSLDFGNSWTAASVKPDFAAHGQIRISTGDTVQMDGNTVAENTVDELIIELGAVLLTPNKSGTYLTVNNSASDDVEIYGALVHQNASSGNSLTIANQASIRVKRAGAIELNSFGDAIYWAGNAQIYFEDSAFYVHNTHVQNTISPGIMFPNALSNERPIFKFNQNYTFPGSQVSASQTLEINGIVDVTSGKTLTIEGTGLRNIRNGLSGDGHIEIQGSATVQITGEAEISGAGKITVNGNNAQLLIAETSRTELLNNREIHGATALPFTIKGVLIAGTQVISGTTNSVLANGGTLITAHPNGVDGTFGNSGNKLFESQANYVFNGSSAQVTGTIAGSLAGKLWVNNASGLTLSSSLTILDTLFLGNGNIHSGASNLLNVEGEIAGYSTTSYVNGPLRALVPAAASRFFPIGTNTYGAISYHSVVPNDAWVNLEYFSSNPHNSGYDSTQKGQNIASLPANEFWKITADSSVRGSVQINYTANSNNASARRENIRVVSWNGNEWQSEGPVQRDATPSSVRSNTLVNQSVFTIGIDSSCLIPSAPLFAQVSVCQGADALLTANGNGTLRWFTTMADEMPFATGNNIVVAGVSNDTNFYVETKNIGCVSNRVPYAVKVFANPVAPSVSGNLNLCYQETTVLSVLTSDLIYWYDDEIAQNPIFIGTSFQTGFIEGDTAFFAQVISNGCLSERKLTNVSAKAEIAAPYTTGTEICEGTNATMRVTANNSVRWFNSLTGTTPFFNGEKFTTDILFKDTAFYAEAFDGQCKSSRTLVNAEVLPLPQAPVLSQAAVCKGEAALLTAEGTNVKWFSPSDSIIPVAEGLSYTTPKLFSNRTYFATSSNGKCTSVKASTQVTVYDVPQTPTITMIPATRANEIISISTTASTQNYLWNFGADATPQTAIGPGPHNVLWTTEGTKTVSLRVWNGNSVLLCEEETEMEIDVQTGLSAREVQSEGVSVYPNPVSKGELFVKLANEENVHLIIVDALGRKVLENQTYASGSAINTNSWMSGVYFIQIVSGAQVQSVKVVKH